MGLCRGSCIALGVFPEAWSTLLFLNFYAGSLCHVTCGNWPEIADYRKGKGAGKVSRHSHTFTSFLLSSSKHDIADLTAISDTKCQS